MSSSLSKIVDGGPLFRFALLTRRWRQIVDQELRTSGLTDATWRPLFYLNILGDGTRQKELAEALGVKGPSLVRLLETLQDKGLIESSADALDRRAKRLSLSSTGKACARRVQQRVQALEEQLLAVLNEEQKTLLPAIIQALESGLETWDEHV